MRGLALLSVILALASGAKAASRIDGVWLATTDDTHIQLTDQGGTVTGRTVSSNQLKAHPDQTDVSNPDPSLKTRPLKGLAVLQGFKGGPSEWKGGTIYDPSSGQTHPGALRLVDTDTLKVTGCLVYPLCKTFTWKRAP